MTAYKLSQDNQTISPQTNSLEQRIIELESELKTAKEQVLNVNPPNPVQLPQQQQQKFNPPPAVILPQPVQPTITPPPAPENGNFE